MAETSESSTIAGHVQNTYLPWLPISVNASANEFMTDELSTSILLVTDETKTAALKTDEFNTND